jgi:hypothetical protein
MSALDYCCGWSDVPGYIMMIVKDHDEQITDIFKAVRQLMAPPVKPKRKKVLIAKKSRPPMAGR